MVTIEKDGHRLKVSAGAYNDIYKAIGYKVVGKKETAGQYGPSGEVETEEQDDEMEDTMEKPVSEMNFRELQAYADYLGIDAEGMTKKELRTEILKREG